MGEDEAPNLLLFSLSMELFSSETLEDEGNCPVLAVLVAEISFIRFSNISDILLACSGVQSSNNLLVLELSIALNSDNIYLNSFSNIALCNSSPEMGNLFLDLAKYITTRACICFCNLQIFFILICV